MMLRRALYLGLLASSVVLGGCGGDNSEGSTGSGGANGSGGAAGPGSGSASGSGGSTASCNAASCEQCLTANPTNPEQCATTCNGCSDDTGAGGSSNPGAGGSSSSGDGHVPANDCITDQTCNYDADCSSSYHCNGVVHQCFDPNPVASTVLHCDEVPCVFDSDCPASWKCSTSTNKCFVP